jgi:pimeloyl-ACP methyl ester carboxylesterase
MTANVRSDLLEIAYEEGGAHTGHNVLLLRGWPGDVRGWRAVAIRLQGLGYRTLCATRSARFRRRSRVLYR